MNIEYILWLTFLYGVGGLTIVLLLVGTIIIVRQQTSVVIERLGRFNRFSGPGLRLKIPIFERVAGRISHRVQELNVEVETKTNDNVFVQMQVSVQYLIENERVFDAFYKLTNRKAQIRSYVFDVVRARVPKIELDGVFERKDEIADAVRDELSDVMEGYGYNIVRALVTDIEPDERVKASMNEINAQQRLRMAAEQQGEANKILQVKAAEAEAESKKLQGQGIADQRNAIIAGLRQSVEDFQKGVEGADANDVMTLVLLTQYFDTLSDIGRSSKLNTLLIPHSPGNLAALADQLRDSVFLGNKMAEGK